MFKLALTKRQKWGYVIAWAVMFLLGMTILWVTQNKVGMWGMFVNAAPMFAGSMLLSVIGLWPDDGLSTTARVLFALGSNAIYCAWAMLPILAWGPSRGSKATAIVGGIIIAALHCLFFYWAVGLQRAG